MKTPLIFSILVVCTGLFAQSVPNPNTGSTPVPINPGQTSLPFNGTNPAGEPNQSSTYTSVPGANTGSTNFQPSIKPNPVTPITTPTVGANPFHHLFQDPSRTPRDPKSVDPEHHSPDGSRGKYHKPKKAVSAKTFANNRTHIKTAKHHGEHASEKTRNTASTESTR